MLREIIIFCVGSCFGAFLSASLISARQLAEDIKAEHILNKKKSDYLKKRKIMKRKANDFKSLQS